VSDADVRALREGDLDSREERLRRLVERAERGDDSAADALRAVVRDYRDFHRSIYCRALNRVTAFGDASLEAPLLSALADTQYNCQAWAASGCADLGLRAAVPGLIGLLGHPQWIARERAIMGLGALGDEAAVPALAPLLGDPTSWVRHRTADALADIGGDAALAALWAEFERRRFERIGYVASALAQFAPDVIPRLIEAAGSPDADQRYWAVTALGSTGDERVACVLERLIEQDSGVTVFDGRVSTAAKKALRTLRRIQSAVAERAAVSAAEAARS
jgi:HEAT repeat protein